TNPLLSVNEDPSDAPTNAGAEEVAAATGNEPAASSVPASGAPERDNKWPDGTRVMVRNKPKSWSEATIYTRLDAEYWSVQYPSGGTGMFKGGDIRAYDAERDAKRARQPRRALASLPATMMPVSSASSPVDTAGSIATTIRTEAGMFRDGACGDARRLSLYKSLSGSFPAHIGRRRRSLTILPLIVGEDSRYAPVLELSRKSLSSGSPLGEFVRGQAGVVQNLTEYV